MVHTVYIISWLYCDHFILILQRTNIFSSAPPPLFVQVSPRVVGYTYWWINVITLFSQMIGTAALIVCILAIVDPYNNPIPRGLEAFTVGFVVLVIGLSMGFNSGYAVNPARDLGPRLFTALAGWGTEVFTWVFLLQNSYSPLLVYWSHKFKWRNVSTQFYFVSFSYSLCQNGELLM